MARRPLIIQTPQQSLIGGAGLARASGLGVPEPDIYGPLAQLSGRIMARQDRIDAKAEREQEKSKNKAEAEAERLLRMEEQRQRENQSLQDQMQARRDAAGYLGKNADGTYAEIPELDPAKSPDYNRTILNEHINNTIALIRKDTQGDLTRIQNDPNIDEPAKIARIRAFLDAKIASLPPGVQSAARNWVEEEFSSRSAMLTAQKAQKDHARAVDGVKIRFKDAYDAAVSNGASGAGNGAELDAVFQAIDATARLADPDGLDKESQQQVKALKERAARDISSTVTLTRLANAARDGQVHPDDLEKFGQTLATAGQGKVVTFTPGRPGPLATTTYDADELREQMRDPATTQEVGVKLQQIASAEKEAMRAREKQTELATGIAKLAPGQVLPSPLRDDFDAMNNTWINRRLQDTDAGLTRMVDENIKVMRFSPPLLDWMESIYDFGDYNSARRVAEQWHRANELNVNGIQLGNAAVKKVEPKMRAKLDALVDFMALIGDKDPKAQADDWVRFQQRAKNPDASVGKSIATYNNLKQAGTPDFQRNASVRFQAEFGPSMPLEFEQELEAAYHVNRLMSSEPDQNKVFEDTWKIMQERWAASEIYDQGAIRGKELTNPNGFGGDRNTLQQYGESLGVSGPDANQWINDYAKAMLRGVSEGGVLVAGQMKQAELQNLLTEPLPLGKSMWLESTGSDLETPQFHLLVQTDEGKRKVMVSNGGVQVPLIIDPHYAHSYWESKFQVEQFKQQTRTDVASAMEEIINDQWTKNMQAAGGNLTESPLAMDPEEYKEWYGQQPAEFQQRAAARKKDLEDYREERLKELEKLAVPRVEGLVGPEEMFQSKLSGQDVTVAAVRMIEQVLPDGTGGEFMLRIAATESTFGTDDGTFRTTGDKGIFQINTGAQGAYRGVQAAAAIPGSTVAIAADKLRSIGIDVRTASIDDLDKPAYSAAFARLHMLGDPRPIPKGDIAEQARLWKDHYNTYAPGATGTVEGFMAKAADIFMPAAHASALKPNEIPGAILGPDGVENPANFLATEPETQAMALRLSSAFGHELTVTAHGGKNARATTPTHPAGIGLDFSIKEFSDEERKMLVATAVQLGYRGLGTYPKGSVGYNTVHFDLRPWKGNGPEGLSLWYSDQSYHNAPAWFREGIDLGLRLRRGNA